MSHFGGSISVHCNTVFLFMALADPAGKGRGGYSGYASLEGAVVATCSNPVEMRAR